MKLKEVRVSNPDISDIPGMVMEPAKMVGAFAVGVGVGNLATAPITDAIDRRFTGGGTRGAVKLAAATGLLTAIALLTEKAKNKPKKSENTPLLAAASIGAVSRLVITGIDDVMGRTNADFIDATVVVDGDEAMSGTIVRNNSFLQHQLPVSTASEAMAGYSSSFAKRSSFGNYMTS